MKTNNPIVELWKHFLGALRYFFIPDNDVISHEALKRLRHPQDRKVLLNAYDDLRQQRLSGIEQPKVTVNYSDGTQETIVSIQGATIINSRDI